MLALGVAHAARAPNAVERELTWRGEDARAIASWFGLDPGRDGRVALDLARGNAWAVYLLKHDTPVPLLNDNDGSPPRQDVLVYQAGSEPRATLGPYWLDLATRLPTSDPGRFMFASPPLPEHPQGSDGWSTLARRLMADTAYRAAEWRQVEHCLPTRPELCFELHQDTEAAGTPTGHGVAILARP